MTQIVVAASFWRLAHATPAEIAAGIWETEKPSPGELGDHIPHSTLEKALWSEGLNLVLPLDGLYGSTYQIVSEHDAIEAAVLYQYLGVRVLGVASDTDTIVYATEDHKTVVCRADAFTCTWYDMPFWHYIRDNPTPEAIKTWTFTITENYHVEEMSQHERTP